MRFFPAELCSCRLLSFAMLLLLLHTNVNTIVAFRCCLVRFFFPKSNNHSETQCLCLSRPKICLILRDRNNIDNIESLKRCEFMFG